MTRPRRSTAAQVSYKEESEEEGGDGVVAGEEDEAYEPEERARDEGRQQKAVPSRRGRKKLLSRRSPPLPNELLNLIISHNRKDFDTLLSCCLVSSTFLAVARPLLYRSWDFDLWRELDLGDEREDGFTACEPSSYDAFRTLQAYPHFAALVRHVTFRIVYVSDEEDMHPTEFLDRWQAIYMDGEDCEPSDREEYEQFWEETRRWTVGGPSIDAMLGPLLKSFTSLVSVDVICECPLNLDRVWDSLSALPKLKTIKLRLDHGWWSRGAGLLKPKPIDSRSFVSVPRIKVSKHPEMTSADEVEFRRRCKKRRIELVMEVSE